MLHRDTTDLSRAGTGDGSEEQFEGRTALACDAAAQCVLGRTTKQAEQLLLLFLLFNLAAAVV
jgi:hypothetical protein